ncbi:MAG: dihydrofolate reductase family protein [Candidatus Acidiferrales bacterium]
MRKLIMWNLMTLDGYFEGAQSWALDWHEYVWGDELERLSIDQLHTASALVFGRVTYEGMAGYWQTAKGEVADFMNRLPKLVFSRTLEKADWAHTTLVTDDAAGAIRKLKREGEGNMFVFGSANLSAYLIEHGLFDEYRLGIAPVIIGCGKSLFGRDLARLRLKLIDARSLSSGCVILRYEPLKASEHGSTKTKRN